MTEAEWQASDDPAAMLPEVTKGISPAHDFRISDRKLRLFACATLAGDSRPDYPPLATAEGFAEGRVGVAELREVWRRHCLASEAAPAYPEAAAEWARSVVSHLTALHRMTPSRAAHLLRDIVGNPFRRDHDHIPYHKSSRWFTPTVVSLAHAAYDSRDEATGHLDPVRLSVLADALEEAGCPAEVEEVVVEEHCGAFMYGCEEFDAMDTCTHKVKRERKVRTPHPLLAHLRSPGPHVRGCHVVDLLAGRE